MECFVDIEELSPSLVQPIESSGNSSEVLYTPQVKSDLIPRIGQQFENLEDVHQFYNNYARESGFGTRVHSSKRSRETNEIIRKEFVCCKEGMSAQKNAGHIVRRRGIIREGCSAKVSVVKDRSNRRFIVSQFIEVHNHPLTTPKRVHLLRSHRKVSVAKKALTEQLAAANVPTHQQMSILELQSGGLNNVGFLEQDLYNIERDRRKMLAGHDANMLYEHFLIEQKKNSGFMFAFENDDEGRMTRCFWADVTSRKSYQYFGDVVVFDTTYNTNRYSLIFAPILGVNHHGQTTIFGCGFLSDETSESFEWFFKEWLKAMPAGPPGMIITDQDPAMAKAIATVLPSTHHRYCIWHIVSKFSEKISAISYKDHYEEFRKCIWDSESPEEFESRWVVVLDKTNLSSNEWLNSMYKIRDRWIPAYMNNIFSAHMTSSQRAEISHAFFKKYVSPNNSLWDFVTRFERALSRIRHKELDFDHKDVNEKPILKTLWVIEKTMSELYTRTIFYKFQEELFQSMAYLVTITYEDEQRRLCNVGRAKESGFKVREIFVEKSTNYVRCTCKKFECDGIPCRHMLAYFARMQIIELPDQFILRRWIKSAKAMRVRDDLGGGIKDISDTPLLVRRNSLFQLASSVIDDAISTENGTEFVREGLNSIQKKLLFMKFGSEGGEGSGIQVPISLDHSFKEPHQVRAKGCGKRLKGGKEKAKNKSRRCNGCGLTGQSHDKRNCPKLLNISSQDGRLNDENDEDDDIYSNDDIEGLEEIR